MTCICGHEFCYRCSARYLHETFVPAILFAKHDLSCPESARAVSGARVYGISGRDIQRGRSFMFQDAVASQVVTVSYEVDHRNLLVRTHQVVEIED